MVIAYDVQPLATTKKTGIEYVTLNIVDRLLASNACSFVFQLFSKGKTDEELAAIRSYAEKGVTIAPCTRVRSKTYNALWLLLPVPYRWFFREKADITHFQNNYAPPGVRGKVVTTIHDILPYLHPQLVSAKSRLRAMLCTKASIRRSDHIVTVSEFSKREMMRRFGVRSDKITVALNGVDTERFNTDIPMGEIEEAKAHYGIEGRYALFLGSLVPHKNLPFLLRAYAKAVRDNPALPALVLGGGGKAKTALADLARTLGIGERVRLIGYVREEHVPALLRGAEAFLFPSLYEGFGMPPLEAMACGTPVVASSASSLPEVVGDAGLLADPTDENGWAEAIVRICTEKALRASLIQKGTERAKLFAWEEATEQVLSVYRKVLAMP